MSFSHLLLLFVVALVVLGPKKMPQLVSQIGRWAGKARAMARQFREQLETEINLDELNRPSPPPRPAAPAASQSPDPAPYAPPAAESATAAAEHTDAVAPQSPGDTYSGATPVAPLSTAADNASGPAAIAEAGGAGNPPSSAQTTSTHERGT